MKESHLTQTLKRLTDRSSSSIIAHRRIANRQLNALLLRRLSAGFGQSDSFLASPIFEIAREWKPAPKTFEGFSGDLLHPDLVNALDSASSQKISRELHPHVHQVKAWDAAKNGLSCLVSSGTGSGKTECFMLPIIDDLLNDPKQGRLHGIRAIIVYPLNALIESQRERLSAWTEQLSDRITFALYNGLTPEKRKRVAASLSKAELGDRRSIRDNPPSILITNVTMLEYMLLRPQDQNILKKSQGLLRWIVLDEAHGYIGAQAAEMALLLRRVRAAFGVKPEDVRLMATSATISDGNNTSEKLSKFVSDLAGVSGDRVCVIEGESVNPKLPERGSDNEIDVENLVNQSDDELWRTLAPHPKIQKLKQKMVDGGVDLKEASKILFDSYDKMDEAQVVLDAAAQVKLSDGKLLLPWRAHIFHRAQGGIWACINDKCKTKDSELMAAESDWRYGKVWLKQRDSCDCGAPVFEIFICSECGDLYLKAGRETGTMSRLVPLIPVAEDDYSADYEPDPDTEDEEKTISDFVWLYKATGDRGDSHINLEDGTVYENGPPEDVNTTAVRILQNDEHHCCASASDGILKAIRYSSPFLMGNTVPVAMEKLSKSHGGTGLPSEGRRAISFSDSRQGVARLAARFQQDAERNLVRAFLYHKVHAEQSLSVEENKQLEDVISDLEKALLGMSSGAEAIKDMISEKKRKLAGHPQPVRWGELASQLSQHIEFSNFATKVWVERDYEMSQDSRQLAQMFLFRELLRKPRVQNNAETMGLVRFCFPELNEVSRSKMPQPLSDAGLSSEDWLGVIQSALDMVFRDRYAVKLPDGRLARWVIPRRIPSRSIYASNTNIAQISEKSYSLWYDSNSTARIVRLIYKLIGGSSDNQGDRERVQGVLDTLWDLIIKYAAKDAGVGAYKLDFDKSAIIRLDEGWLCPVTRRILAYNPGNLSPFDPECRTSLKKIEFPRLPFSNSGGLTSEDRERVSEWCFLDEQVRELRQEGIWTNLHDRIASYAPFLRAQEHSAQIERPILQKYEEDFKDGRINLLNCSTTMEMGVDIPDVSLVVNSNVPPSTSNYRQRVGRAGRRGEPWAFAMTFCRDLPLDTAVFAKPRQFLSAPISAPTVRLDSSQIINRHVHAALLGAFIRKKAIDDFNIMASSGSFFGAGDNIDAVVGPDNLADSFLVELYNSSFCEEQKESLKRLVSGSSLDYVSASDFCAETAKSFEKLLGRWRNEYEQLLNGAASASDKDIIKAYEIRAKRMRGEFLLSDLARRGFTPSYGFPIDVVNFDHLSKKSKLSEHNGFESFGERHGGASRTLDIAIREYAPGAEIVINGLVYQSEGIQPAWSAIADASKLEDLQFYWECPQCLEFGILRSLPDCCPHCEHSDINRQRILRPAGFLGKQEPHAGYENLQTVRVEMPRLSAAASSWQSLPNGEVGRMRANADGLLIHRSSGSTGKGYAVCLACGQAEVEENTDDPIPKSLRSHFPLAPIRREHLKNGYCPGSIEQQRIQRNVSFVHATTTSIFELQLPRDTTRNAGLAVAVGLREALAEKMSVEAREIGVSVSFSKDISGEKRVSCFVYDKASGGAGLSSRLIELDGLFTEVLEKSKKWLDCGEDCDSGCPSCILRPDLNFGEERLDRRGGLQIIGQISNSCKIPDKLKVFGEETRVIGSSLSEWVERNRLSGKLKSVTIFLHGNPKDWELADWPMSGVIERLGDSKIPFRIVLPASVISDGALDMACRLDVHRIVYRGDLCQQKLMPEINGKLLLAVVNIDNDWIGLVATESTETIPGPKWGEGALSAVVRGPYSKPEDMENLSSDELIQPPSGNAQIIWIDKNLDGSVGGFGKRFWKLLSSGSLDIKNVQSIEYSDRYLLTPLNLRLLSEVITAVPNEGNPPNMTIDTAHYSHDDGYNNWAVFHSFGEDWMRKKVIEGLFPGTQVNLRNKNDLPHSRSLTFRLHDGRTVRIILDQGFGSWNARGYLKHDFRADVSVQAKSIRKAKFKIEMREKKGSPMVVETL